MLHWEDLVWSTSIDKTCMSKSSSVFDYEYSKWFISIASKWILLPNETYPLNRSEKRPQVQIYDSIT